jgi:hypothetical protein
MVQPGSSGRLARYLGLGPPCIAAAARRGGEGHDLRAMRSNGGRCRRLSNKIPQWLRQTTIIGPDGAGDLGPAGMGANVGSSSILQQRLPLHGQRGLARLGFPSVQLPALRPPPMRGSGHCVGEVARAEAAPRQPTGGMTDDGKDGM